MGGRNGKVRPLRAKELRAAIERCCDSQEAKLVTASLGLDRSGVPVQNRATAAIIARGMEKLRKQPCWKEQRFGKGEYPGTKIKQSA